MIRKRDARSHQSRSGFTLIELLVVIAIIAILAAILFPVFARARENARRSACLSNTRQIGLGLSMYIQDYDERFPSYYFLDGTGWHNATLPYIKSKQLFVCPNAVVFEGCNPSNVDLVQSGSYGYNYHFLGDNNWSTSPPTPKITSLAAVQQASKTVAICEITGIVDVSAAYIPTAWRSGAGSNCSSGPHTVEDQFATRHFDGNNIVFIDGHAKWMKKSVIRDYDGNGVDDNGLWDLS